MFDISFIADIQYRLMALIQSDERTATDFAVLYMMKSLLRQGAPVSADHSCRNFQTAYHRFTEFSTAGDKQQLGITERMAWMEPFRSTASGR